MAIRLAVYTLLLFASWEFNLLGLPDAVDWSRCEPRSGYLGTESHLILYRLQRADIPALHPLFSEAPHGPRPYRSQFGAQGIALSAACRLTATDPARFAPPAASAFALLTALVVAGVFAAAHRDLGPPAGDVACVLAAFSPVFVKFAPSLYWVPFLLLAPFALVWVFGPRATTAGRRAVLVAGVGMAVYCKALCGYEYITTVILAPLAAAWFHQHRAGESPGRKVRAAAALVAAGLAGFALALGTHVAQIEAVFDEDGVAVIRERAVGRTTGGVGTELPGVDSAGDTRLGFAAKCFREYFGQRVLSTPAALGRWAKDVPLLGVVTAAAAFVVVAWGWRQRLSRDAGALAGGLVIALAGGVSWQVLAVNHMCVHRHLNLIVFAVPFLPLAFVAAGYAVTVVGRRVGVVLLGSLPLLMAGNLAHSAALARAGDVDQRHAETAIAGRLTGPPAVDDPRAAGAVDRVGPAAAVAPALLVEWGLFDANTGGPADPNAVVVSGWAVSGWRSTARPSARVVAVCGGKVVACRVQWYRRPDLDALAGKPMHRAGFVAVIPSAELVPGERVRVFVLSASDPTCVTEVPVP
ncbi:MAG: hypothetical protein JWO38_3569 [Gemmataceae bacterium]|nr:hypothetical protein [Gemmataceae bacterium]